MKLLFDENLPGRLVLSLAEAFPGSAHVRQVGLKSASDAEVWEYAKKEGFALTSKDADFHQMSFLLGVPPKVVWIRIGNSTVTEIEDLMLRSVDVVEEFAANTEAALLILS